MYKLMVCIVIRDIMPKTSPHSPSMLVENGSYTTYYYYYYSLLK